MNSQNKNFLKILTVLVITMSLMGIAFAAAPLANAQQGLSTVTSGISMLQGGLSTATNILSSFVGGPPWLHGMVAGAFSAYNTYQSLDDKIKFEDTKDMVNISQEEKDFYDNDIEKLKLNVDPNCIAQEKCDLVLTDKNVLDVDFIETKTVQEYIANNNSPTLRVAEKTEKISVIDTNNVKTDGQRRALLFTDDTENQTIKDSYEYRVLLISYIKARYESQPVKVSVNFGFFETMFNNGLFGTGANKVRGKVDDKLEEQMVNNRKISPLEIQKFHLLFNSRVDDEKTIDANLLDCTSEDGKPIGTTGTEVLPKVVYDWQFIANNKVTPITGETTKVNNNEWCDVTKNGIYCDSTQFTIEALQKINTINEYVRTNNAGFTCPVNSADQSLISDINNVGITYLKATLVNGRKATIEYRIKGNYQISVSEFSSTRSLFDINYTVVKKSPNSFNWITVGSGVITPVVTSDYLNTGNISTTFNTPNFTTEVSAEDTVKVVLTLTNFNPIISNHEVGNNLIDNTLEMQTNSEGTTACNIPKTSENLMKYDPKFNEEYYHFKAYLMKDGYSSDFKKDFDDYYRFVFNGSAPDWYGNGLITTSDSYAPLYKYFIDAEKFKFKSSYADSIAQTGLPGPGRYNVKIIITYDDQWKLFNDAGDMTGKIEIVLDKEQGPELDSPIYYMPLDGVVGSTGDKTRNGYGVDYLKDKVPIFLNTEGNGQGSMYTEGYISSNTISTVETTEIKDFTTMNNGNERGKLLSINKSQNNVLKVRYIPSRPTPVVMKVTNEKVNTDAYAFYKLAIGMPLEEGGEVANPGTSLAYWTGFAQCNDFTGVPLLESFLATPDIVSTKSELAPVTQSQSFSYGIEWNKDIITRTGNVWMYAIFYTPSNFRTGTSTSHLYIDSANDSAKLFTTDSIAPQDKVELKNVYGTTSDIQSMKHIFKLVTEKKACINYDGSTLDVYYNPKEISMPLTNSIDSQLESNKAKTGNEFSCIRH